MSFVELCSSRDETSFIVPAYEFRKQKKAESYMASTVWREQNESLGSDAYALFSGDRRFFVPRLTPGSRRWRTSEIFTRDPKSPNQSEILRATDAPMPADAVHVALLVEGPRTYRHKDGVERHGYAAWSRMDGRELTGAIAVGPWHRVYPARVARGVIYSSEKRLDRRGAHVGFQAERIWFEFSIQDGDSNKDDTLSVRVSGFAWGSSDSSFSPGENSQGLDKEHRPLMHKAFLGFQKYYGPVLPKSFLGSFREILQPTDFLLNST